MTVWDEILARLRSAVPEDDFRRWFGETAYASDAGDQITVWVPTEATRRHIAQHYDDLIRTALGQLDREDAVVRFVVAGTEAEEDETE